ncbi:hypothetical protein N0V84_006970 [Fusarium piperis]|uniref:Uncharacterized protein n=1 Tax=Fusarium piperis TaxID=1435070 RepID=A0A9W9BP42_9HYPO|nr:hypothetical protein N0V84_006970 [Fusarium piperis]
MKHPEQRRTTAHTVHNTPRMPSHIVQQMHETTLEQKWKNLRPLNRLPASTSAPPSSSTVLSVPISHSPIFTELAKIPNEFRKRDAVDKKDKVEEDEAEDETAEDKAAKDKAARDKAAKDAEIKKGWAESWDRVERALAHGDEYVDKMYPMLAGITPRGVPYDVAMWQIYEEYGSN